MIPLVVHDFSVATTSGQISAPIYVWVTPLGFDVDDFLKLFPVFSVIPCTLFFSQPLSTPAPSSYVLTTSMCYFPGSNHDLTTYIWVTSIHCSLLMLRCTYISSCLLNTATQMSPRHHTLNMFKTELIIAPHPESAPPPPPLTD